MKKLTVTEAKRKYMKNIFDIMMFILKKNGNEQYSNCFTMENNSIFIDMPKEYFYPTYEIPEGIRIEMKFVVKK